MTGKDMIFAMTKEQYIKITEPLRSNPERANRVTSLNHVLTALVFCVYPLYLFMLFADKDPWLWRAMRPGRMKNLTCRRCWKKTQKEKHFQAGTYFLFSLSQ